MRARAAGGAGAVPADGAIVATSLQYASWGFVLGPVPVVLLGVALLSLTVAGSGFAYLTQQGTYDSGMPVDAGWFAGHVPIAVVASAVLQLRRQAGDWFLYWSYATLVVLVIGRQLPAVLDHQALNRRLQALVDQLEHQAFHDGLTGLASRATRPG